MEDTEDGPILAQINVVASVMATARIYPKIQVGAQSEMLAAAWLLGLGYDVFRNVSSTGPIDMIAVHRGDGTMIQVDVKTARLQPSGNISYPRGTKGIKILVACLSP